MCFSRNCSEMVLIQCVMQVIIQLMRNKMIKLCTEVLRHKADPSQPALLRGALPARGIPLSCGVKCVLTTASSPCCWDSANCTLGQGVCGKKVRHKDKPKLLFPSPFLWRKHVCWKETALDCEKKHDADYRKRSY